MVVVVGGGGGGGGGGDEEVELRRVTLESVATCAFFCDFQW